MPRILVSLFVLVGSLGSVAAQSSSSALFGVAGEAWDRRGRLPDFSYAGYRSGSSIPTVPVRANVRAFGAKGDGRTDDTSAFEQAIAATRDGALLIPRGRYVISRMLKVTTPDVVLRGEGSSPTGTVLSFTKSLSDLFGKRPEWSWSGGLIRVDPELSDSLATTLTEGALRGDTTLTVADATGLRAGQLVMLRMTDDVGKTLGRHLYNAQATPGPCENDPIVHDWPVRIHSVRGKLVQLVQPLRLDARLEWRPRLYRTRRLSGVGIEHLRIEFPATNYAGHLKEPGYNGVYWRKCVDGWMRDVAIRDSDSGVIVQSGKHLTLDGVRLEGRRGHHGILLAHSADCLATRFRIDADFVHALTVGNRSNGCVFSQGRGSVTLEMDHHTRSPFENLFTAMRSAVNYNSSGNACNGPRSGARATFWNLPNSLSPPSWGYVQVNVVGRLSGSERRTSEREWYERIDSLQPEDLYVAQRAWLARKPRTKFSGIADSGDRARYRERDPARWRVTTDCGDARYELFVSHPSLSGLRPGEHSLLAGRRLADAHVTARFRSPVNLVLETADVVLVLGYEDDENYDFARFSSSALASGIYRVVAGSARPIAFATRRTVSDNAYHRGTLVRNADTLVMTLDGDVVARASGVPMRVGFAGVGSFDDRVFFDDVEAFRSLNAQPPFVSLSSGGRQSLALRAGLGNAGRPYLVVGTASGTSPGIRVGAWPLPLNADAYLGLLLAAPDAILRQQVGVLTASGRATAAVVLPPGLDARLVNTTLHHAFLVFGSTSFLATSNPEPLLLTR